MVQSLNTKALVTLASVIRRPSLMVPHVSVDNISEINYEAMKEHAGIRAVIFDKDNTLTAPYAMDLHPLAVSGLEHAKRVFGAENVAIMSNSAGTRDDPEYKDAQHIETALGISVIRHEEKKPGGLQEVLSHFQMDDAASLCMVGDRLLTDVVFGNLYGMLTIHTLPLCRGDDNQADNIPAKLIRSVENKGLYGNWFGGRMLQKNKPTHKYWAGELAFPLVLSPDQTSLSSSTTTTTSPSEINNDANKENSQ